MYRSVFAWNGAEKFCSELPVLLSPFCACQHSILSACGCYGTHSSSGIMVKSSFFFLNKGVYRAQIPRVRLGIVLTTQNLNPMPGNRNPVRLVKQSFA